MPMPPPPPPPPGASAEAVRAWQDATNAWAAQQKANQTFGPGAADSNAFFLESPEAYNKRISELPPNWDQLTPAQHQAYWDKYFSKTAASGDVAQGRADTTYGQSQEEHGQQQDLIKALQAQAAGQGPSLAQAQLGQATDANMRGAMSLGAAQQSQGLGHQAALRGIGDQRAAIQQQAAGQSSIQRMMEQLQSQQQLASMLGTTRAQDLGYSGSADSLSRGYQQDETAQNNYVTDKIAGGVSGVAQGGVSLASSGMMHGKWAGGMVDSPANDTVPAMLSPGEIVLPLSVTQSEDPAGKAAAFVEAVKAQKRARRPQ